MTRPGLKILILGVCAVLLTRGAEIALACGAHGVPLSKSSVQALLKKSRKPAQSASGLAPFAANAGVSLSLESMLGNLLLAENTNAIVSLPVVINNSDWHPFSDGQSDAKLGLGTVWTKRSFPAIGVQRTVNGTAVRTYKFDPGLGITDTTETNLGNGWFKVQAKGRADFFYFNFDTSAMPMETFLRGIPASMRTFSGSRLAPDPEKIGHQNAYQTLLKGPSQAGYNAMPFPSDNVHAHFPTADGPVNAVGGVLTWGIDLDSNDNGPFKQLYTCFDARNPEKESQLGVPSGAGWHRIGNPAETLLHDLEQNPIPAAIGRTHGFSQSALGMSEVITAFWLQPDQAFVTVEGQFHWYLNPYPSEVCTEVWVHNCVPQIGNNWGLNCPRQF